MTDERPRIYENPDAPPAERVSDLVGRMTLEEKVGQTLHDAPAIDRLGVPAYNWWNECLHGVARAGVATVFPQAIGMAAAWDPARLERVAAAISDEGRAKHHEFVRQGDRGIYKGLTFWTPNINIVRDPRWGRGHETYGECPFLTGRMAVAFVRGLQGDDPTYLKSVATPKHYAVHSGPEPERHRFDARVSQKDLYETYLPAFRDAVVEGGAYSVMGAYNRTNGEPCCASPTLLGKVLREAWDFEGYVVSDCGAIGDIHTYHHVTENAAQSAALAVKNGCELDCGSTYRDLLIAVDTGLITEAELDTAVKRLFTARFKLGLFDPPERVPWAQIPYERNDCEAHHELARDMARATLVLLKNAGDLLPLSPDLTSLAVVGPNADSLDVLLGNYFGTPSQATTLRDGIRAAVGPETRIWYAQGSPLVGGEAADGTQPLLAEAVAAAERADAAVLCLGISPSMEGEEGDVANSDGGGDRTSLGLPVCQTRLLKAVVATGTPVVLVLTGGSSTELGWAHDHVPAILQVWYPGGEGGGAVADVLFGRESPAGRLPVTFYRSLEDLPPFADYAMQGRTYRYFAGEPLYPFGYGLSYTTFAYRDLTLSTDDLPAGEELEVRVTVENTGDRAGAEVVQLYLTDHEASVPVPMRELRGFRRIRLAPGAAETVSFALTARHMALINEAGEARVEPGAFTVSVGGHQPDARSQALAGSEVLSARFTVTGDTVSVAY